MASVFAAPPSQLNLTSRRSLIHRAVLPSSIARIQFHSNASPFLSFRYRKNIIGLELRQRSIAASKSTDGNSIKEENSSSKASSDDAGAQEDVKFLRSSADAVITGIQISAVSLNRDCTCGSAAIAEEIISSTLSSFSDSLSNSLAISSSSSCFKDFEGTFVTSSPRASIFVRNSTSSWLVSDSTFLPQARVLHHARWIVIFLISSHYAKADPNP